MAATHEHQEHIDLDIYVEGYGTLSGLFTHNAFGWICEEYNTIRWDYVQWGVQPISATPEEAARWLLDHAEADADEDQSPC